MKQIISNAKKVCLDRDGFVYGFLRGTMGSMFLIAFLSVLTLMID